MHHRNTVHDRAFWERHERAFVPPHCPREDCPSNAGREFRFVRYGWHERRHAPFLVQRFRCETCKRTFSTQTFRYSYFEKRPDLDRLILNSGRSCSGNRQIATMLECSKSTVAKKIERLGRHAIRFLVDRITKRGQLVGTLVFDGLGSFEFSQYNPYWLNTAVHDETGLVLGFSESPLRRSGTMTDAQRVKRTILEETRGRPPRDSIRKGTAELLTSLRAFFDWKRSVLRSDEHPAYPLAVRDAGLTDVPHERIPGTLHRNARNPLWQINLADLTIRHGNSSQRRETIAFNKRRQAGLERAWIWATWRNFMHPRYTKRPRSPTPAMEAGLADRRLRFSDIFDWRLFGWRQPIPPGFERQIRRDIATLDVPNCRRHRLKLAY